MSNELIQELVLKYSLENAVKHNGIANDRAVMQKIMASHPELRKEAKIILIGVEETVTIINKQSLQEQIDKLEKIAPELLEKKESGKREYKLEDLLQAKMGEVVTRYAPEPNGEMHLGHAYTAYFAHAYAKKYQGTFILRFEDTNPKQERIKYMDAHKADLNWLGLDPDKVVIVSNDMPVFYEKAEELIKNNHAYTCTCKSEVIHGLRNAMEHCKHAKQSPEESMKEWKKMLNGEYNEGEIILRLRGDIESKNAVMRDPAIFAIRKDSHCIHGDKYKIWPLYDFAVAIEDYICGITHVARSAEFDTRIELQNKIREFLGMVPHPLIIHYSRFNVVGSPASKRMIIPLINEGKVEGWDDIRLVTIKGLRRRGIIPETIKQIILEVGMTPQPTNVDWSLITTTNRKIIDYSSNRYFFVPDPVILYVQNVNKTQVCKIPLHMEDLDRGYREIKAGNLFLISKDDFDKLKENEEFRLKDLFNVKLIKKKTKLVANDITLVNASDVLLRKYKIHAIAEYTGNTLKPGAKLQWLPAESNQIVPVEVKIADVLFIDDEYNPNSLSTEKGVAEESVKLLPVGSIIQFERYGFVRIDGKNKNRIAANLAHK
ncbi:MAG: glutamate--tRNA ligase [Candidatus Heimdallarchaeota archaeon]|nr:glutamate--tRNA ligase [Candidatus Heimdallarchaeota archaeon]